MASLFLITMTNSTIKPIQILNYNTTGSTQKKVSGIPMKNHIRKILTSKLFNKSHFPNKIRFTTKLNRTISELEDTELIIQNETLDSDTTVKLKRNSFYHFGWKQLYNKYLFLDVDQKFRNLKLFKEPSINLDFYQLDKLITLLKSEDTEFTMTAFAFSLFSATKSLYHSPKNSTVNDIKLSVLSGNKANKDDICDFMENIVQTIVKCNIYFDYSTGNVKKDILKEYNIYKAEKKYMPLEIVRTQLNKKKLDAAIAKIKRTNYVVNYQDYPIIVCNHKNLKYNPNKHFDSLSASPIYIDYIDDSSNMKSMYISIHSNAETFSKANAPLTQYLSFIEAKLSAEAYEKFKSKQVAERLKNKITSIINNNIDNLFLELGKTEITTITNSLFGIYFHKNQKISYFNNLYQIASKQLSFPNNDPERVRIYSYLLASLISFKEYVDELPPISPYYDPDDESYQPHNFKNNTKHSYGLESDYHNFFIDNNDDNDYEEYTPLSDPPIIDITPYKQEFYALFDQTVKIFKKRCVADNNADINISYDDKLIQLFDCFITKLINEDSNIIIKPAKTKQGLIFLDFHSYFEHFELFLEKQDFNYSISKQKFNRMLYDNKILKPRYNGSDKTPPKLDYILQINEQKYTVLAIKLDILKAKISELSK